MRREEYNIVHSCQRHSLHSAVEMFQLTNGLSFALLTERHRARDVDCAAVLSLYE